MEFFRRMARKSGSLGLILMRLLGPGGPLPLATTCLLGTLFLAQPAFSRDINRFTTNQLSPSDYLFGANGSLSDPVFDRYRTIDLSLDLGITSDCGRIDVRNTLRAALQNVLNDKYLKDLGRDIIAGSPMLLTCYFSPTWCAILKHAQLKANYLAQLRLNQCGAINRFVDQRAKDYYEERSSCIQNAIKDENGDFEKAMERCKNYRDYNLTDWAGDGKTTVNKLIESTAKWAGMTDEQGRRVVDLSKAFVGDTIVQNGEVSIDFGPHRMQLTPRTYLMEVKSSTFDKLCKELLPKLVRSGGYRANVYRVITDQDLKNVSGSNKVTLDHQTMLSLAYMPFKKREVACRKLADALAMGTYTDDMGKALDFISSKLTSNPHLPVERKIEADNKRRVFKDQIDLTLAFEARNSEPLNQVLFHINKEGQKYAGAASVREVEHDHESHQARHIDSMFFDCADGIGCE